MQKRNENEKKINALKNIDDVDERILKKSKDAMREVAKAHGLRIDENKKKKSKKNTWILNHAKLWDMQ